MLRTALVLALVALSSANRQQWLQDAHVGQVRVRKHACARVFVRVCSDGVLDRSLTAPHRRCAVCRATAAEHVERFFRRDHVHQAGKRQEGQD